jgi:drug/metabolite transporter (DMT)-like permease
MDSLVALLAVSLLAASQLLQKAGADRRLRNAASTAEWVRGLFSYELMLASALIVAGTGVWLYVLYRMDVSRAFPFFGAGSVLVVLLSQVCFGERISGTRWVGIALIVAGVTLVAQS